jgi:glycine/D-amino acid oxidase-like deaminating enzyme
VGIDYRSDLPRTAELVVIGSGIAGAAAAFHAARAGLRPLILERRPRLCSLTTAAAAGGFRLQLDNEEELRLIQASVELLLDFAEATGQSEFDPAVRRQGYLWLTTTEAGIERQGRLVEAQRGWGVADVELLDGDEVRQRFPWVAPEVRQGRFRAGDGLIDPKAVTLGLVAGSGAPAVAGCGVTGFVTDGGRLRGVETTLGTVSCEAAVIAAGPFSGWVAALAGVELPVEAVQRQKVVMPDVPEVPPDAPMTIDDDTGAHWRPAHRGAFVLFTDPATPPTPPSEDFVIPGDFALGLLDPSSPVAVARVAPFWRRVWDRGGGSWSMTAGQYTMTPDLRPLIGGTPVDGLYVNAGYGGHGVMMGPGASRHLVDVITGKVADDDNPFRLDRAYLAAPHLDPL